MKILVFGKANSGKSKIAEEITLKIAGKKPLYVATYLDNFGDLQMKKKIELHKKRREGKFITIEEPCDISIVVKEGETYLIECLSMLVFNNLGRKEALLSSLKNTLTCKADIVFVLNEVEDGFTPEDEESKEYAKALQSVKNLMLLECDEVYEVREGIKKSKVVL